MQSRTLELEGPVHVGEFGGTGQPVVCVHGLSGSSLDWQLAGPLLATLGRVVAPDLPGFGRTPPAGRATDVTANAALLALMLEYEGPSLLIGNSMGGLIALLTAASRPDLVRGLVLLDAALPAPVTTRIDPEVFRTFATYALPRVGEARLRRLKAVSTPESTVAEVLRSCCAEPDSLPPELIARFEAHARERRDLAYADAAYLTAARSLLRLLSRRRYMAKRIAEVSVPTLVVHGERDRLVPSATARTLVRRRPDWTLELLPGVGHLPQLEDPAGLADAVRRWWTGEQVAQVG